MRTGVGAVFSQFLRFFARLFFDFAGFPRTLVTRLWRSWAQDMSGASIVIVDEDKDRSSGCTGSLKAGLIWSSWISGSVGVCC